MTHGNGRRVALISAILGAIVLGAAGLALRTPIREQWHILRLGSKDAKVRDEAVESLADLHSRRAVPRLMELIRKETEPSRWIAAVCRIGPEGAKALVQAIQENRLDLRAATFKALGSSGPEVVPVLVAGLRKVNTRSTAVDSLAAIGPRAIPGLLEALGGKAELDSERAGAATALGRIGALAQEALPLLRSLASDAAQEDILRGAAGEAVDRITGTASLPAVDLRLPPVDAEPGGEAVLEIRANLRAPIRQYVLNLDIPKDAARAVGTSAEGTATAQAAPQGISLSPESARGGAQLVVDLDAPTPRPPIEPGDDILLLKVLLKIAPEAKSGDHPIRFLRMDFVSLGARSLSGRILTAGDGLLRVRPRTGENHAGEKPAPGPPAPQDGSGKTADPGDPTKAFGLPPAAVGSLPKAGFVLWAGEARAEPGAASVPVKIYAANPVEVRGFSFGLRLDPAAARIEKLSIEKTASEENGIERFMFQRHVLESGETAAGFLFGAFSAETKPFPAGSGRHVATVLVAVPPGTPPGTMIPVHLGAFGEPPGACIFTVKDPATGGVLSQKAEVRPGLIAIGASRVPEIVEAAFEDLKDAPADPAAPPGPAPSRALRLTWKNSATYDAIRIERDGKTLDEIRGTLDSLRDGGLDQGPHRYRLFPRVGKAEGFPAVVEIPAASFQQK